MTTRRSTSSPTRLQTDSGTPQDLTQRLRGPGGDVPITKKTQLKVIRDPVALPEVSVNTNPQEQQTDERGQKKKEVPCRL